MSQHILPDFRHILAMSDKDRIDFMDMPRWLGYPLASTALETMRDMMNKPTKPRMPNLLLIGDPNNGKTTIARRFVELYGQGYVNEDSEPVKPVIYTNAPPSADEKGLYIHILECFWAPYRATDSMHKLRYQVIHQFRACHVKLLIIDELHSLLTGTAIKQREIMNAIKTLCNELMIPIIGIGTTEAVQVLHTDPQHASRFDVFKLTLWEPNDDFRRLLNGFEQILPLKKASKLSLPELAGLLHAFSGGNLGELHKLLTECAKEAIISGKEHIDKQIIESKKWVRSSRGIRELTF